MAYRIVNFQPVVRNMPTGSYDEFGEAQAEAVFVVMTNKMLMRDVYLMGTCLGGVAFVWQDEQFRLISNDGQMNTVLFEIEEI